MTLRRARRLTPALGLLLLGSCSYPCYPDPDRVACDLAARSIDVRPVPVPAAPAEQASEKNSPIAETAPQLPTPPALRPVLVPPEVPGGDSRAIELPQLTLETEAARNREIDRLFPPLPALGQNPQPPPGQEERPLELGDLQRLALGSSPLIKQAAADVEAARGVLIQAGAYPNPTMGLESDAIGEGDAPNKNATAGQIGGFVSQTIKTKGKLGLAQAGAEQDLRNAEYALRRAEFDLLAEVRGGYFAVLSARENMRVALAFARFSEAIYGIQVGQLKAGHVASYEPLQFRALAVQARFTLAQARHRYVSAWRQLAASIGMPSLPLAQLAGRIDMPLPVYRYEDVAARVLARHTDVLIARATLERARYNLRLAQVTPFPDIDVRVLVQKDYTTPPHNVMTGVQVGGPIPVWDHNRGNILQAEAQLVRATEEEHRVRDNLARQLADAFERYNLNRELLAPYRGTLLPDQVRVFNGIFERYLNQGPKMNEVSFIEIAAAQQNLAASVTAYLQSLGEQWRAVVDIASLLQTEDLFQMGQEPQQTECLRPLPDFEQFLPGRHPCSTVTDPAPGDVPAK